MRPDVKLGVVSSMVFVLVAGMYFLYRDRQEQPIQVAEGFGTSVKPVVTDQRNRDAEKPFTRTPPAVSHRDKRAPRRSPARRPGQSKVAKRQGNRAKPAPSKTQSAVKTPRIADAASKGQVQPVARKNVQPAVTQKLSRQTEKAPVLSGAVAELEVPSIGSQSAKRTRPGSIRKGTPLAASRRSRAMRRTSDVAVETHRVQSGDTLTALSKRYYGSTRHTQFLIKSNPSITNPDRLKIGMVVRIPPKPAGAAPPGPQADRAIKRTSGKIPSRNATRTYRVKSGDSFYVIARDVLGDSARWKELFELNRQAVGGDPVRLQAGQLITLPQK